MQKFHVKRGDQVVVLAGSQKGKSGKVLEFLAGKQRARVEGLATIMRHAGTPSIASITSASVVRSAG